MTIYIPVSVGEVFDKISILEIKKTHAKTKSQKQKINQEIDLLFDSIKNLNLDYNYFNSLYEINKKIWEVEDSIREKEKNKVFDLEFIELARKVYFFNDKRFEIKKEINKVFNSEIREFKFKPSYE